MSFGPVGVAVNQSLNVQPLHDRNNFIASHIHNILGFKAVHALAFLAQLPCDLSPSLYRLGQ